MSANMEALVIGWLNALPELDGIPTFAEVPADRPSRFVTVERVGGGTFEFVDHPHLAVQAWAQTRFDAAVLADTIRANIGGLTNLEQVASVNVTSMYNWPDPHSRQARYQLTVHLSAKWNHT